MNKQAHHGILTESLAAFHAMVERVSGGMARFDLSMRYMYINPANAQMIGVKPVMCLGRTEAELGLPAASIATWQAIFRRALESDQPVYDTLALPNTGKAQEYEVVALAERGEDGAPRAVLRYLRPLPMPNLAEESLRALYEQAAIGIKRVDLTGRILDVNQKLADILGYSREELMGYPASKLSHPDDRRIEEYLSTRLLLGQIPSYTIEKRYLRHDGQPVWVRVTSSLTQEARHPYRIAVVEDISERKEAEREREELLEEVQVSAEELEAQNEELAETRAALEAERRRYQSLFEFAPDGYLVTDQDGVIYEANQAAAHLLGVPQQRLAGENLQDYIQNGQSAGFLGVLQNLQGKGRVEDQEIALRPNTIGASIPVSVAVATVRDDHGRITSLRWLMRDISGRKRAEQERERLLGQLQAQRELLEAVVARAPASILFLRGDDLTISLANSAYQAMAPGKQILGRTLREVWPEVFSTVEPIYRQVLGTGEPYHVQDQEFLVQRSPDSPLETRYFSRILTRVRLPDEEGWGVLGITIETTERVLANQRLQALAAEAEMQRAQLETVISSMVEGVLIFDPAGKILTFNPAGLELFGYRSLEEARQYLALDPFSYHTWDLAGRPLPDDQMPTLRVQRGETFSNVLLRMRRTQDGREWVCSYSGAPVRNARGEIALSVLTVQDLTEQVEAEQALRENEALLRDVLENSQDAIYRRSLRTQRYEYFSPAIEVITGFRPKELIGMTGDEQLERIHPEDRPLFIAHNKALDKSSEKRPKDRIAYRWRVRDGSYRWLGVYRTQVRNEQGQPFYHVGSLRDITEQKQAEQQLLEINNTLEKRVAERTERLRALAAELSRVEESERKRMAHVLHDHLQQLLVAARLNLNGLQHYLEEKWMARVAEHIDEVLAEAIQTSRSLTAELSPPVLYDAGLAPALRWLAHWMEEKYGLAVEVNAEDLGNQTPETMRAMLFQAARELLFNVVKHAEVKNAELILRRMPEDEVELAVYDQGKGFDPSQIGQRSEGGFGLFSIRERLELLGGHMRVESGPSQGTRITLQVSIQATEPKAATRAERAARSLIRVLLVDDHAMVRQGLARLLTDEPDIILVGEARDGSEAITLAQAVHPDIVLMDVSMPVMDGIEATRRILAEMPEVKVIGLSMHEGAEVAAHMREAGAVDFLSKGGDPAELVRAVQKWGCSPQPQDK